MRDKFIVKSNSNNDYIFTIDQPSNELVKIYFEDKLLTEGTESKFVVSEDLGFHPVFTIEDGKKKYKVAERTLPISGMNNFRDMGGYEGSGGKHVKWNKLFRSDHLYNADTQGLMDLKKLDLKVIIDFRSDDEISKYPNPILPNNPFTIQLDPRAHAAELSAQFTAPKGDEDENLIANIIEQKNFGKLVDRKQIIMEQYNNFVFSEDSKKVFREVILQASNDNAAPLVQHCRGGKDRTGFGALLILGTLGVSEEDIIYDYMLTEENRIDRNNVKMEGYKKITQDQVVLDYLFSLIETREDFIQASLDLIKTKYDSIQEYVKIELEIDDEVIEKLHNLYLE